MSEPAVTVLGEQLEEITNGHIKKNTIRMTLAVGIGFASVLALIKILTGVNILWFFLPLYATALVMMLFTPKLFVGLAFDSGGVAGGALTSAFLTPLTLGVSQAVTASQGSPGQSILMNGFGIIAFISVTPLIAVQLLGIVYNIKLKKINKYLNDAEMTDLEELAALASGVVEANEHHQKEDIKDIQAGDAVDNRNRLESERTKNMPWFGQSVY